MKQDSGNIAFENAENSSKPWYKKHLVWQLAFLVLLLAFAAQSDQLLRNQMSKFWPETVTFCSSYNEKPSGYRALFELCEKVGLKTGHWQKTYRSLRKERGCLFIVAPTYPIKEFEAKEVLDWVAQGNDLVYIDYFVFHTGKQFRDQLGLDSRYAVERGAEDVSFAPDPEIPQAAHVKLVSVNAEGRLQGGKPLLKDDEGALAVEVLHGKGRCFISCAPNICANLRIADEKCKGNFQFMINWLRQAPGRVLFDEKCHGYMVSQSVWSYLVRGPVGLICWQVLILLIVALYSHNQRFGSLQSNPVSRKLSSLEFIDGMALTYEKARAYDAALSILFTSFKSRLCKALSISPEDSLENLANAWSEATGIGQGEIRAYLEKMTELLKREKLSQEEMTSGVSMTDDLSERSKNFIMLGATRRVGS